MNLQVIDWALIVTYFSVSLTIGLWASRHSGKSTESYFSAGKNMPWWLLGVSMVATTFSTDTPNLVTDIVRRNGVSGNWVWWAFLFTGMLTVFVYARLWKRSGVLTDIAFYELRYSGKPAAFLRGFRAVYLGFFFNTVVMATVSLAAIKIGSVMMGFSPVKTILVASLVTAIYSSLGGLKGVLLTDFLLFILSMVGAIAAMCISLNHPSVGGISGLLSNELVISKLSIFPDFSDTNQALMVFLIPVMVQWWNVWYPGAEPGGGGYVAQRMIAAKNEKHATVAVFFFNVAHYVLRPWPWIIVALCSLVVFPDLQSLKNTFPHAANVVGDDLAYPAMLTFLPAGILGMVVTSLVAAYMSTISTHLNWGASYLVHDFYRRFLKPDSTEKELVAVGRITTFILMVFAGGLALLLENALDSFKILLQIGAGTGLLFILRWFWWRINAVSEITAMTVSFLIALYFEVLHKTIGLTPITTYGQLIWGISITTTGWLIATLLSEPTDEKTLLRFVKFIRPGGPGWQKITDKLIDSNELTESAAKREWQVPQGILAMLLACLSVYSLLFSIGYLVYGHYAVSLVLLITAVVGAFFLIQVWKKLIGA